MNGHCKLHSSALHAYMALKNLANQKQELPVAAILMTDWDEMSNLYRGHSIYASYQVSVHLAEGFQRHISVIQFIYLYRDNRILNTDIYI